MLVTALIRDCVKIKSTKGNDGLKLTIETESPLEIHEMNIYGAAMENAAELIPMVGKVCQIPVKLGSFNGNAQLEFPMGARVPKPIPHAVASAK